VSTVVVDTSAMVAILTREPGHDWLSAQLASATERLMSAPAVLELGIVLEARAPRAVGVAHRALREAQIRIVPFDEELAERAQEAWRRFGKGRHLAALNFGDCCTYALADQAGHPVLCVGEVFGRTDLPVLQPPPTPET
jgi:ribonuclease VapC